MSNIYSRWDYHQLIHTFRFVEVVSYHQQASRRQWQLTINPPIDRSNAVEVSLHWIRAGLLLTRNQIIDMASWLFVLMKKNAFHLESVDFCFVHSNHIRTLCSKSHWFPLASNSSTGCLFLADIKKQFLFATTCSCTCVCLFVRYWLSSSSCLSV